MKYVLEHNGSRFGISPRLIPVFLNLSQFGFLVNIFDVRDYSKAAIFGILFIFKVCDPFI